jgi:serine/threonine-protein kinase HipA
MAHELEVWLFQDHVGTLSLVNGRLSFQYHATWLAHPDAKPLSIALPLQTDAFDDVVTRPFFAGLLPEGQMRQLIAKQFQVSKQNDFALLDRIGGECAGAVTFLAPEQSLPISTEKGSVQWLSDHELLNILELLPRRPMPADQDGLRLSLAELMRLQSAKVHIHSVGPQYNMRRVMKIVGIEQPDGGNERLKGFYLPLIAANCG